MSLTAVLPRVAPKVAGKAVDRSRVRTAFFLLLPSLIGVVLKIFRFDGMGHALVAILFYVVLNGEPAHGRRADPHRQ